MKRAYIFIIAIAAFPALLFGQQIEPQDPAASLPENPRARAQFFRDRVVWPGEPLPVGMNVKAWRQAMADRERMILDKTSGVEDRDWVSRGPHNIGGRINCVAINPLNSSVMYIGAAAGGIWRSYDGATSWHCISDALPTQSMGFLVIDPVDTNIVYAGTGEVAFGINTFDGAGMFKSTDGGTNWTQIGQGILPEFARVSDMAINPLNRQILYAAIGDGVKTFEELGIWRTTDGGATWTNIFNTRITDIEINPLNPLELYTVGTPVLGGSNVPFVGFHKSTDGGDTWTNHSMGVPSPTLGRTALALCASQPNIIYSAVSDKAGGGRTRLVGVFKSTDAGETWSELEVPFDYMVSQGWYDNVLGVDPGNPDVVVAGGVKLLYSSDGGQTWDRIHDQGSGGLLHVDQHAITFDPQNPGVIYNGNDGGLYRISNNGALTEKVDRGMSITQFIGGGLHPTDWRVLYGGCQDNGTMTGFGGPDFNQILYADGGYGAVNTERPNIWWATQQYGRLFRSEDHGRTWYRINGDMPNDQSLFYTPFELDPKNPETLYYGTRSMYRTTDEGVHWERLKRDVFPATGGQVNFISAIHLAPYSDSVIVCGASRGGGVALSTDAGDTWTIKRNGLPESACSSVHTFAPGEMYATFSSFGAPKVWRSTDTGTTWQNISGNLPEATVNDLWKHNGALFVASAIGVFVSEDEGANWRLMQNGIPSVPAMKFYWHGSGILRAYTHGRGIWDLQIDDPRPRAPKFVSIAPQVTLHPGETFRYTPVVDADPPADYRLLAGPSRTEFDETFGAINWRASDIMATFKIEAYNSEGSAVQEFTVYTGDVFTADWEVISPAPMPTNVYQMEVAPDGTLWVGRDSAGVSRSTDGGYTWQHWQILATKPSIRDIAALSKDVAYAGTRAGDVLKTTDGGQNWQHLFYRQGMSIQNIHFWNEQRGLFVSIGDRDSAEVMHTTDAGATWSPISPRHYAFMPENATLDFMDDAFGWYASTNGDDQFGRFHSTTDGGFTWKSSDIRAQGIAEIAMFTQELGFALDPISSELLRTTNGSIWAIPDYPVTGMRNVSLDLDPQRNMMWAVNDSTAWVTRDTAKSWTKTTLVYTGPVRDAVFADSLRGWVITHEGVVERLLHNPIALSADRPLAVSSMRLDAAYPNPLPAGAPEASIPFSLDRAMEVSVTIYGSTGKKLETVFEGQRSSGSHTAVWNATGYAPGVYFYTLSSGNATATGQITVVR